MKLKQIFLTVLGVLTLGVGVLGFSACGVDNDENGSTQEENLFLEVYDMYVTYAEANGVTPDAYEEWLEEIRGEQGIQGEKGEDGRTPVINIGWNGNWFVDGVDTNVSALGKDGEDGKDGADGDSISGASVNEDGQLILTFTSGKTLIVGNVVGPAGKDGEKGKDGFDGKDGEDVTAIDLYETAKENGYEGSYLEFCQNELKVEVQNNNDVDTIASNITSVVSVFCGFSQTTYYGGIGGIGGQPWTDYYHSAGSGVIIDLDKEAGDALIVTSYHVVYNADHDSKTGISDSIYLYTYGALNGFSLQSDGGYADVYGDGMKATYVGGAMDYDIAILRVENSEYIKTHTLSEAEFANSEDVRVGEKVYAIGNPDGSGISVTEGIVSVESEYIQMASLDGLKRTVEVRVMRTNASLNSGNSGGALFNAAGELIGIINAKNSSLDIENIGYALPITHVKNLCGNILANYELYGDGSARVATLGVTVAVTESESYFEEDGALRIREEITVSSIGDFDAAIEALEVGDVLTGIKIGNGEWVGFTRKYDLFDQLLTIKQGDIVQLTLLRNGVEMTITVTFYENSHFVKYS